MLNALAAVQGGLQARENAFQGQASEQYRNALAQYGMEAPQTRQAFAAVDPRGANSLMMQERQMTQQGQQFEQTMGLREREFEATNADRQARLQITRQNAARQAMALTAQMTAAERAREAEVLERALATATTAQTPEDWDRIMTGFGEQGAQFVGQFERRDEIFAGVMGLTDALKAQSGPEFRRATAEEAAQYGATAGQFGPDGRFHATAQNEGPLVEITNAPGQSEFENRVGRTRADRYTSLLEAGEKAVGTLATVNSLETALSNPNVYQGSGGQNVQALRRLAVSFGASPEAMDAVADGEVATALSRQMALALRDPSSGAGMPGAMSDSDRQFLVSLVAGLDNTREGNTRILRAARTLAERQIEIARKAEAYVQQNNTLDGGFTRELQQWADSNPMFGALNRGGNRTPAAAGPNSSSPGDPMPSANLTPSDILAMPFEQLGNVDVMTVPPATFDALERRLMERK